MKQDFLKKNYVLVLFQIIFFVSGVCSLSFSLERGCKCFTHINNFITCISNNPQY